jgi:NADH:ubiquinone oxidoreductase subunit 5 (subunit L)/multisubunit Na+/H+ antiporter MnhA subunit
MKINYLLFLFEFQVIILIFGLLTFLLGGLFSFSINDIKKAVAFSTLSQLGIIIIRLRLGNFKISFYHIIIHALFKSSLFISLGIFINYNFINQNINNIKKINLNKISNIFFLYSNLNLIGIVSIVGFFSKDQVLFFFNNNFIILYINIIIYIGCIFTGIYSIKFIFILINEKFIYSSFFFQLKINFIIFLIFFSLLLIFFTIIIFQDLYISDLEILIKISNKLYFYIINILSLLFFKIFKFNYYNKNLSSILIILDLMFQIIKKIKFMNKFYLFIILEEFSQLNLVNTINLRLINVFNINIIIITFL